MLLVAVAAHSVVCSVPSVFHEVVEFGQCPELAVLPQEYFVPHFVSLQSLALFNTLSFQLGLQNLTLFLTLFLKFFL